MAMDIQKWLTKSKKNWQNKNVEKVLKLFTDDVEYYETPTQKLENKEEIREEWRNITERDDIELGFEVYSRDQNKYTVKWHLEYEQENTENCLNGIYLIKLNDESRCVEFWQYCQFE